MTMKEYVPHNPFYNPEKFNLNMISFDEPELYYEYNTLCFWRDEQGKVFSAADEGCSCPTPFESYEGKTTAEVCQKLERVESLAAAETRLRSWVKAARGYQATMNLNDYLPQLRKWWLS